MSCTYPLPPPPSRLYVLVELPAVHDHLSIYQHIFHADGVLVRIIERRGKWLLTGRLVRILPAPLRSLAAAVDRLLWRFHTDRAWDVFIVAEKVGDGLAAGADDQRAGL